MKAVCLSNMLTFCDVQNKPLAPVCSASFSEENIYIHVKSVVS